MQKYGLQRRPRLLAKAGVVSAWAKKVTKNIFFLEKTIKFPKKVAIMPNENKICMDAQFITRRLIRDKGLIPES